MPGAELRARLTSERLRSLAKAMLMSARLGGAVTRLAVEKSKSRVRTATRPELGALALVLEVGGRWSLLGGCT